MRVLPGDRDLALRTTLPRWSLPLEGGGVSSHDPGRVAARSARHRTITCYLPTKRAKCTKYFIVLAALRPDDPAHAVGSMPLFPAIFFATLIAAVVYVAGRYLVIDDQE